MSSKISFLLIVLIVFTLFCSMSAFSHQVAITETGKKVLLKDDGTWEYVKEQLEKESAYDFRKTNWGMSKVEVKKTEKIKLGGEQSDVLWYAGEVDGFPCHVVYIFAEGKLVRAKYIFTSSHTNKNDYISDFKTLKETLTKKYGKPIEDTHIWKNDLYKDEFDQWGFAISLGHLVYFTKWGTSNTTILLFLSGENYQITLGIEYGSEKLKNLEEKVREKEALDEF